MNTTNIVSTPNITGNVGSCETKEVTTKTSDSLWTAENTVILTNSCTGKILYTNTYTDYSMIDVGIFGLLFTLFFIVIAVANN